MRYACIAGLLGTLAAAAPAAWAQVQPAPPAPSAPAVTAPATAAPLSSINPPAAASAAPLPRTPNLPEPYGAGLKVNISADGQKYIRFLTWHQFWTRYTRNNAGTLRAPGKPQDSQVDFGLRRSRLILLAQLNPRFLIYTHLGFNNQNAVSGGVTGADGKKPQLFVHEAVTEYKVNKYLNVGAGLHYQLGLSRMTNASTLTFLALDAPLTNWPTIDQIDQFARWLGVYAKGRVGKFDYRVSVNDAFLTNLSGTPLSLGAAGTGEQTGMSVGTGVAAYNPQNTRHVYQGYFSYNFLEPEANLLPFMVGSYLGTKRVLTLGGGFLYNQDGMYYRPGSSAVMLTPAVTADPFGTIATRKHDIRLLGFDVFYDTPLNAETGTALTAYAVYYHFDFGPNYVRYVGALNPGYGAAALRGNAVPQSGTGGSFYAQAGYLTPKSLLGSKMRLQPYLAYQHSAYEGLRRADGTRQDVNVVDAGANFFLDGHNAKFSLNYRHRPDFTTINALKYRPELTLQTMIYL